jgi:excisionase family DNA binding protein
MEAEKLLWSVREAGNALGLSPWTIRRYITDGKMRTVRLGRRVLVEPSECLRLVEEGRGKPAGQGEYGPHDRRDLA